MRSFAQGMLSALGVAATGVISPGVSVPWLSALQFGGIVAVCSVLTSLASITVPGADPATASFLGPPGRSGRLRTLLRFKTR